MIDGKNAGSMAAKPAVGGSASPKGNGRHAAHGEEARAPGESLEVFDTLQTRILTHWHEAREILERKMPAPRTAIVYPTYVCNQDCLWCEYNAENTS